MKDSPQFNDVTENMSKRGYDPYRGEHGTKFSNQVTTHIDAPKQRGSRGSQVHGLSDSDRTYYVADGPKTNMVDSWGWARMAAHNKLDFVSPPTGGPKSAANQSRYVQGRPVVHKVEPEGTIGGDHNLNPTGKGGAELTADRLKITDTEWIMPAQDSFDPAAPKPIGTQGTLPNQNWNRYHSDGYNDYNNKTLLSPHITSKGKQNTRDAAESAPASKSFKDEPLPGLPGS